MMEKNYRFRPPWNCVVPLCLYVFCTIEIALVFAMPAGCVMEGGLFAAGRGHLDSIYIVPVEVAI